VTLPAPRASGARRVYLRIQYRLIRLLAPIVRSLWRGYGLGNVVELRVVGRHSRRPRPILLGLLQAGGHWFLGHPNGDVAWTRNLEAAGTADLSLSWPSTIPIRATRLPHGELRDQAILATSQHVFPGNIVYRLARRHVRAVGTYFLIEVALPGDAAAAVPARLASGEHGAIRRDDRTADGRQRLP
jgi:hypothetical protein